MMHCPRCGYEVVEAKDTEQEEEPEAEPASVDEDASTSTQAPVPDAPDESGFSDRPRRPIAATTMEQASLFFVLFPWGEEQVFDVLNVGRDPEFSPLAREINEDRNPNYEFVSGAHARFEIEDETLYVEHVGYSNPTFVGGAELVRGSRMPLYDGAEVQFSNYLSCTIAVRA
jgi:hypothetical protein